MNGNTTTTIGIDLGTYNSAACVVIGDQPVLLRPEEGTGWQFRTRTGTLVLEDSVWIDGAGRPRPCKALVVTLETPDTGVTIPWSFRRVS